MKLEALFEEVPIVLKRSHLVQQLLAQEYGKEDLHMNTKILQISPEEYTTSHM
jgi:hypothetical protein